MLRCQMLVILFERSFHQPYFHGFNFKIFLLFLMYIAEWFWPEVTGSLPPPCAEISFIKTSDLKVVVAGGYEKNTTLLSGVYQLNLENWVSPNSQLYHVLMLFIPELYLLVNFTNIYFTLQYVILHIV